MKRQYFVDPDVEILPLFDDGEATVTVKKQLNAGDQKALESGALRRMNPSSNANANGEPGTVSYDVDFAAAIFGKIMIYLVDWTVPDKTGKTVSIDTPKEKQAALRNLHPDVFKEIERVIDEHAKKLEGKKSTTTGESGPATI